MGKYQKMFRGIPNADRFHIKLVIRKLVARDFSSLDRKKLSGYESLYRVRVGNYRIIYSYDRETVELKAIRKRDESTYKNL